MFGREKLNHRNREDELDWFLRWRRRGFVRFVVCFGGVRLGLFLGAIVVPLDYLDQAGFALDRSLVGQVLIEWSVLPLIGAACAAIYWAGKTAERAMHVGDDPGD